MAIITFDNFEGTLAQWSPAGATAVSAGNGVDGTQSIRMPTVASYALQNFGSTKDHLCSYVNYHVTAPSAGNVPGMHFQHAGDGSASQCGWFVRTDLKIGFRVGTTEVATSTQALTLGSFPRIKFQAFIDNAGTGVVTVDGVEFINYSGDTRNTGSFGATFSVIGHLANAGSDTILDFDNWAIGDALTDADPFTAFDEEETPPATGAHRTSSTSGVIYEMAMDIYDDDGCEIRRVRRSPHISAEQVQVFFQKLELMIEAGQGLNSGQGSDPKIMLRWSDDGGKTWSNEYLLNAGKIGEFRRIARRFRMGRSRDRTFEIAMSDPIKWAILDGFIDYTVGTT